MLGRKLCNRRFRADRGKRRFQPVRRPAIRRALRLQEVRSYPTSSSVASTWMPCFDADPVFGKRFGLQPSRSGGTRWPKVPSNRARSCAVPAARSNARAKPRRAYSPEGNSSKAREANRRRQTIGQVCSAVSVALRPLCSVHLHRYCQRRTRRRHSSASLGSG